MDRERIFAFAAPFTWNEVLALLRRTYPERTFAENIEGLEKCQMKVPNERAERLLKEAFGKGWTSLEETVLENVRDLVEGSVVSGRV